MDTISSKSHWQYAKSPPILSAACHLTSRIAFHTIKKGNTETLDRDSPAVTIILLRKAFSATLDSNVQ